MEENPDAGLCTGQMYNSDKSFHHSFNYFPTLRLKIFGSSIMRLFSTCNYPSKKRKYMTPIIVPSITGAAMFIKSEVFSKIGGFDPNYFLYCEEEDLCYRIKANSYNVYLVPDAKFIHHMGKSTNRNNDNAKEYYISLLYFIRKYYTNIEYTSLKFIYFFKNLKKFYRGVEYIKLAFFILQGAPLKYSLRFKQKPV
jgi:GT2 family glycosyltransferase